MVVMNPAGDVARQQADLILWSTGLMLIIIVPVIVLTVLFAWKYRASNTDAEYRPDWDHSTGLELVIWAMPLLIIIALGALTWLATHTLDPYRPLTRIAPGEAVTPATKPLVVEVVSLDWKWLFLYPEQGIATVNQLVVPVNRPIQFKMTSSSVMNTFYVPAMAGMIYTMPGMETQLHAVLNKTGTFEGMSANYSGAGFSYMHFPTRSVSDAQFGEWVESIRRQPDRLSTDRYLELEKPSERVPAMGFNAVQPGLWDKILGMCVKPGTPCMQDAMAKDMHRGAHAPVSNRPPVDKPDGALFKAPEEKKGGENRGAPIETPAGSQDRGGKENRSFSAIDRSTLPGVPGRSPAVAGA